MPAKAYGALADDEEQSDNDDIDDLDVQVVATDPAAQPLLLGPDCEEAGEGAGPGGAAFSPWKVLQGLSDKAGNLQLLQKRSRRRRGLCPVCGEAIRDGAHHCDQAKWKLREGLLADSVRCDGNVHFKAGRYEEAVASYSRALQLSPEDARLWGNRAAAHTKLRRPAEALLDAEAAIQKAPSWFKGYFRKARILEAEDDWDGALAAYALAAERCTRPEEQTRARRGFAAARARCRAVQQVRQFPPAFSQELLEERWRVHKWPGPSPADLGEVEVRRRLDAAEAAKADGNCQARSQDWEAAGCSYGRGLESISFCPRTPLKEQAVLEAALMLNLALVELQCQRPSAAVELCHGVLRLNPRSAKAHFRLALALEKLGDSEAALREADLAMVLEPADAGVLALRRKLHQDFQLLKQREKEQCSRMLRA